MVDVHLAPLVEQDLEHKSSKECWCGPKHEYQLGFSFVYHYPLELDGMLRNGLISGLVTFRIKEPKIYRTSDDLY